MPQKSILVLLLGVVSLVACSSPEAAGTDASFDAAQDARATGDSRVLGQDGAEADAELAGDAGPPRPDVGPGCPDADGDGARDSACGGDDCDDSNAQRYPGNAERCDAVDNDCNPATLGPDMDRDTFRPTECCNPQPDGLPLCGTDCDDTSPDISPTAPEVCNRIDDDCDGMRDEGEDTAYYRDSDGDGFGVMSSIVRGCSPPAAMGWSQMGTDCDDTNGMVNPSAAEICDNGVDNNCDMNVDPGCTCATGTNRNCGTPDQMGGFLNVGVCRRGTQSCVDGQWTDCAGSTPPTPGGEVCNGLDDDCNGMTDEAVDLACYADADNDTYSPAGSAITRFCASMDPSRVPFGRCPFGYTNRQPMGIGTNDCVDTNFEVKPGGTESCNGIDDDCSGTVDDGTGAPRRCYVDNDGDTWAPSGATSSQACVCPMRTTTRVPGTTTGTFDCNDNASNANPSITLEVCDSMMLDENCDGTANPMSLCNCTNGQTRLCSAGGFPGRCGTPTQTCTSGAWETALCTAASMSEMCNGMDDDCDTLVDDGVDVPCWRDGDRDGYALPGAMTMRACACPQGWTSRDPASTNGADCGGDTTAADMAVNPGATETCDFVDNNCRGGTDEGVRATCYYDQDNDGYAPTGAATSGGFCACAPMNGNQYTNRAPGAQQDCQPADMLAYPGAAERCNGVDDNCDGTVDEGVQIDGYLDNDNDTFTVNAATRVCPSQVGTGSGFRYRSARSSPIDCNDSNSDVRPNQTRYFLTGLGRCYFGVNRTPCTCGSGPLCFEDFDYNCMNGNELRPPATGSGCSGMCVAVGGCSGGGPIYTPNGTQGCSTVVPTRNCGCPICSSSTMTNGAIGCH